MASNKHNIEFEIGTEFTRRGTQQSMDVSLKVGGQDSLKTRFHLRIEEKMIRALSKRQLKRIMKLAGDELERRKSEEPR